MKTQSHAKALALTSFGVLLISLESLYVKVTTINALNFSFYIGIFMFLSSVFFVLSRHKKNTLKIYKENLYAILLCGVILGVSNIFFISAVKHTSVANAVLIFSCAPIFSAFYAYVLYKEKSGKNIFIASFFIFIGLFVIFSAQIGSGAFIGDVYAFLCAALFALGFVILGRFKGVEMFAVISVSGLTSVLIALILVEINTLDTFTLAVIMLSGLLTSPLARFLVGTGTKTLAASEVSLLMIIETLMAPVWVWLFLKEVPHINTFYGGSIILVTLLANTYYLLKQQKMKMP